MEWEGIIKEYWDFLPIQKPEFIVSLKEGNTPLIRAFSLERMIGGGFKIFLKCEGFNPTGSFKDRGMTVAVTKALEEGSRAVICASTGNTAASAAAYAAKAGMKAFILIPEGKTALGKLSQSIVHGTKVVQIKGNFDDALNIVKEIGRRYPITLVNSINPYRIEGQKTAAFEVCDQLGFAPDYHVMPVGNAGNITAYWKGYREYYDNRIVDSLPKMIGFQAEGAAPIVKNRVIENPETIATAIRIGNPANWKGAIQARDESKGIIDTVTDEEIMDAYRIIACKEGIFCEPASAAGIAGIFKMAKMGFFKKGEVVVCTLTGHGLKDPDASMRIAHVPDTCPAELDMVIKMFGI